jgi:hypothetical protein
LVREALRPNPADRPLVRALANATFFAPSSIARGEFHIPLQPQARKPAALPAAPRAAASAVAAEDSRGGAMGLAIAAVAAAAGVSRGGPKPTPAASSRPAVKPERGGDSPSAKPSRPHLCLCTGSCRHDRCTGRQTVHKKTGSPPPAHVGDQRPGNRGIAIGACALSALVRDPKDPRATSAIGS